MTFKKWVKTGELHFNHNGYEDYDGDTGYYEDIDVPPEEVKKVLVDIIIDYYDIPQKAKGGLLDFIEDFDLYDSLVESFNDDLRGFFIDWDGE